MDLKEIFSNALSCFLIRELYSFLGLGLLQFFKGVNSVKYSSSFVLFWLFCIKPITFRIGFDLFYFFRLSDLFQGLNKFVKYWCGVNTSQELLPFLLGFLLGLVTIQQVHHKSLGHLDVEDCWKDWFCLFWLYSAPRAFQYLIDFFQISVEGECSKGIFFGCASELGWGLCTDDKNLRLV